MADIKDIKIGDIVLGKEQLTKAIVTKKGTFVVRLLDPVERRAVVRGVTAALGHAPLNSIATTDYVFTQAIETLRIAIIEKPDWFISVDQCIDEDLLVNEVYNGYLELDDSVRRRLRQS